jgi:hypothetical protein
MQSLVCWRQWIYLAQAATGHANGLKALDPALERCGRHPSNL